MGEQGETAPDVQKARARQYALCTVALQYDGIRVGAEGVFDQALTNGLVAIVARNWPGREVDRRGRVLSAAHLLDVIEERGKKVSDGVYHVPDRRDTDPEPQPRTGLDELIPDYTVLQVDVLRAAIKDTQAIRHARAADQDTDVTLSGRQIEALHELSHHPALGGMWQLLEERFIEDTEAADREALGRAQEYLALLDEDERLRRASIDYGAIYRGAHKDDDTDVEECPVCLNDSLVASERDSLICEVGIGQCVVCGYERSAEIAYGIAVDIQFRRAVDRD